MSFLKGNVVDGVFFPTNDIRRKGYVIACVPRLDAQTQILGNERGKTACLFIALPLNHCAVSKHSGKAVKMLHRLIGRPMGIDAHVKQFHEKVSVSIGKVVGLHKPYVIVGVEVF